MMGMQALAIAAFSPWSYGMIYLLTSGLNWPLVVRGALEEVDNALERQDVLALHSALQDPSLALRCVQRDNLELYLEQLSTDREEKALVGAGRSLGCRVLVLGGSSCSPGRGRGSWQLSASCLSRAVRPESPLCLLQELGYLELLEQEEVQAGILTANQRDEKERASE